MNDEKNVKKVNRAWFDFSNGVYPVRVMLFIGKREAMCESAMDGLTGLSDPMAKENAEEAAAKIRRCFGTSILGINGECLSVETDNVPRMWIVRMDSFSGSVDDTVMLSHECLHAALSILGCCGVSENPPFEALCYLHEAIFKKFMMDAFGCVGLLKRTQKEASNAVDCGGMAP